MNDRLILSYLVSLSIEHETIESKLKNVILHNWQCKIWRMKSKMTIMQVAFLDSQHQQ